MNKHKLRVLFGAVWLPLYLLVGVSWLLAPALAHEHYGVLRLISNEEAVGSAASMWFRLSDIGAAILLLGAVLVFQVGRRSGWFGKVLLGVALLAAIDGLFPDTCYIGHQACGVGAASVSLVHDIESLLLGAVVGFLSIFDAVKHRRAASIGFVAVQLVAAVAVVTGLGSKQFDVLLQYVYETALVIWLGWLIDYYNPALPVLQHAQWVRRFVGLWVAAGGIFALVVAAIPHVHLLAGWNGLSRAPFGALLDQHGIITGVLMLYVARHLLRGERPALWLATILFYSQIIKYSVLTPQPVALVAYALLLALLIYSRHCFDRNVQPSSMLSRLSDMAMALGGSVLAFLILFGAITLAGQRTHFLHDVQYMYGKPLHAFNKRELKLSERREAHLRILAETLVVSLGAVSLWSLFRPKAFYIRSADHCSPGAFADLLGRYSTNSEDFFKLWPADKAYFCTPGIAGAIAYRVEGGVAFMLADPVAPQPAEQLRLLQAFARFVRAHGWVLCVFVIGGSRDIYEQIGLQTRQIGSSAVIDIARFNTETAKSKWWRWQRNRAARNHWHYHRLVPPYSAQTMQALQAVSDAWLLQGGRTEQGFALGYFDAEYIQQCVVHVLQDQNGQMVAFANELPVFGGVAQASVDLIRHVPDADGAMPALLMHVIAGLDAGQFHSFDLGFVPLAKLEGDLAKLVRRMGRSRFSAAGLEQFKNKFEPEWRPDYIAYDGDLIDLAKIAVSLERLLKVSHNSQKEVQ